jgi:hypothetical protein
MAHGTDLHVQILSQGGTCLETVAAATVDLGFLVGGMDAFFHVIDLEVFSCPHGRAYVEGGALYEESKG